MKPKRRPTIAGLPRSNWEIGAISLALREVKSSNSFNRLSLCLKGEGHPPEMEYDHLALHPNGILASFTLGATDNLIL